MKRPPTASIVPQIQHERLLGWEVWRHFPDTPARCPKARLWFGLKRWRSELGYEAAALEMAQRAARKLESMSVAELRAWWRRHQRRPRRITPDPVKVDYAELSQLSHAYPRRR